LFNPSHIALVLHSYKPNRKQYVEKIGCPRLKSCEFWVEMIINIDKPVFTLFLAILPHFGRTMEAATGAAGCNRAFSFISVSFSLAW
jgi:hypothetical protein